MSKHTPGPWGLWSRGGGDGSLFGWDLDGPPEPQMRGTFAKYEDALLAAAAPDLLEACNLIMEHGRSDDDLIPLTTLVVVRNAIAKAEGRDE